PAFIHDQSVLTAFGVWKAFATSCRVACEVKAIVMKIETEQLKGQEKERDFFCVVSDAFRIFARRSSIALGSAWSFAGAVLVILMWIFSGPMFHFSDTWQLVINTATTIVTFLMVFL